MPSVCPERRESFRSRANRASKEFWWFSIVPNVWIVEGEEGWASGINPHFYLALIKLRVSFDGVKC